MLKVRQIFFVFFLLLNLMAQADDGWRPGIAILQNGDTLEGEIRNHNYFTNEVIIKVKGEKQKLNPEQVVWFHVDNKKWVSMSLFPQIDAQVFCEQIKPDLYKTWLKELKCACDNSYQHRKVWIWKNASELYIFKKRLLNRQLKNWNELRSEILRDQELSEEDLPSNLKFQEVPELIDSLGLNG